MSVPFARAVLEHANGGDYSKEVRATLQPADVIVIGVGPGSS